MIPDFQDLQRESMEGEGKVSKEWEHLGGRKSKMLNGGAGARGEA